MRSDTTGITMMKRTSLALLLLALATPAQALKLIVWDPDLKNKVAYGESSGGRFNVKFDKEYSGPVVALFSQTDEEKAKGSYGGLRSSYEGILRDGQLLLNLAPSDDGPSARSVTSSKSVLPLSKVLQPYKLNVNIQPTGQLLPLSSSLLATR